MDDTALEFGRYEPTTGRTPEAENEIMVDTETLKALGVPAELGATVPLEYEIKGETYTTDFVLCGFWETDSLSNIGRLIVSKAFIDANSNLLAYTYPVDNDYSGVVVAYIMFKGNGAIEAKLNQLLSETGYTCDTMGGIRGDENYINAGVNMPTENFKPLCSSPHVVNFSFNVKPGQEMAMEDFLTSYTENIEPGMDYESKQTYVNSFHDLTSMIITIGGALSIIIGLIGITNFINSMLTSIITRKKEFAMLQSIGMTGKQLKSMLACEGLYYAIGTILASAFFGTLFSLIIVQGIANSIWFFTYRFVIWPMLVIYPFLLAVTIIIPSILYRKIAKTSIIERLRTSA